MFKVKPSYSKGPMGDSLMVVDEERNVWLQRIRGLAGPDRSETFKLVWEGKVIPFDVVTETVVETDEKYHVITHLGGIGSSTMARMEGFPDYIIKDKDEYLIAQNLALEALLAYGSYYDGYNFPNGHHRVCFNGREYVKSDFNLP